MQSTEKVSTACINTSTAYSAVLSIVPVQFLYSAVTEYNGLPQELRDLGPRQFRTQCRAHLLRVQYGD